MSCAVSRRLREADATGQLEPLSFPVRPYVAFVDRPVIVHPGVLEECDVDRMGRVVVTEDDVRHLLGRHAEARERIEDGGARGDHPRVNDRDHVAIPEEADGSGDAFVRVAFEEDIECGQGGSPSEVG